jgi:dTDP-L-rhamnose 4-epimerase
MLDECARVGHVPEQFLLASSRAVYGEGSWQIKGSGQPLYPGQRSRLQLARQEWDFPGLEVMPVEASKTTVSPVSIYGATKLAQEHILRAWASAYGAGVKILRLQNVYGPGQTPTNPYTGIVSLFCRLAGAGKPIPLYEDGEMLRDFILVDDVAAAILSAIDSAEATGFILDVGTGRATTIAEMARIVATGYGAPAPFVCGEYRFGDVRHAICNIQPTTATLDWTARHDVTAGVAKLMIWLQTQHSISSNQPQ